MPKTVLLRIPCYNHEPFIRGCLASVAAQDYPALKVVVADDASTDGTAAVARAWCAERGHRFVQNPANVGIAASLNGMMVDAGEFDYVFALASDDELCPGAISALVAALEADPAAVGAYGEVRLMDATGRDLGAMRNDRVSGDLFERVLFNQVVLPFTWILWTRAAYDRLGGYDPAIGSEDAYIFNRLARLGPIRYCPADIVRYRKHAGNTTARPWTTYQTALRMLRTHAGEPFYPRLRRYYHAEFFFLLSRSHPREAWRYFPAALTRPFRRQFFAGCLNLLGAGRLVDRCIRR
jgi:glycosyltransferase involved in cell wall biosynthesis